MTGISTLGSALTSIDRLNEQQSLLNTLTNQLTTGRKTDTLTGLGNSVLTVQSARIDVNSLSTYTDNITNADRTMELTLNAIEEFQSGARDFADALTGFSQNSAHQEGEPIYYDDPLTNEIENTLIGYSSAEADVELQTLQDMASNLYDYMVDLLNMKDGNRYLLNGADTSTPPVSDSSALDSAISTKISDWQSGSLTTDDFLADFEDRSIDDGNTDALTDTVIGYSSTLSAETAGRIFVTIDQSTEIDYTVYANDDGFRDVLTALSYFKNDALGPIADQVEIDEVTGLPVILEAGSPGDDVAEQMENFYAIFNDLSASVTKAIDEIDQQRFKIETVRARIDQIKTSQEAQQALLIDTIDEIENVDINEVAVQLSALQLQLEATYTVTASTQQLSLVNFL